MPDNIVDNKRIAKNTIILYFRTLFVMVVSLYTSRVILQALGVEDYGVYQVIGGLVSMFSVISASLTAAISRFITFEIGSGDKERLYKIFSTSKVIQLLIAAIVLIFSEIIGVWFMQSQMQIPPDRLVAAKWVLHFSIITFCINLTNVPFNASIIAHEKMTAFAYISIIEAILKLVICYIIIISPIDRLVSYGFLHLLLALIIRSVYSVYCRRFFEESRSRLSLDKGIFKEMIGFSGWSFFNNASFIFNTQGVNMLMNVFFGVTVNAARGIATQVENAVLQFVNNFTTAINPQITKSYATGDLSNMHKLVCRGAKFSYFSMLFLSLPIILEADKILGIWLVNVPANTTIFVQLSLVMGMCDCIGSSGYTACVATGKMKTYTLALTPLIILEFPLTWLFFKYGAPVVSTYYIYIIIKILVLFVRMILMQKMINLKVSLYIKGVFLPIIFTSVVAVIPALIIVNYLQPTYIRLLLTFIVSCISTALSALFIGMTKHERQVIIDKANLIIHRLIK